MRKSCSKKIIKEIKGESGSVYQVEIQVFYDDKQHENLSVICAVNDGGWRAFFPLAKDFIISPDNNLVGE